MLKLTRTQLVVALTLLLAITSAAQRRTKPRKQRTQVPEISVKAPVGSGPTENSNRLVGQAEVSYLGDRDETLVSVDLPEIYGERKHVIALNATYVSKGKKVSRPDSLQLAVYFPSKERAFSKPVELVVESDAGRFNLGVMEAGLTERIDFSNGTTWKGQAALVDFNSFERIVGGRSVTLRLAGVAFELKGKQLAALRDLIGAIEQ